MVFREHRSSGRPIFFIEELGLTWRVVCNRSSLYVLPVCRLDIACCMSVTQIVNIYIK